MNVVADGTGIAPENSPDSSVVETARWQQHAVQHTPFQTSTAEGSPGGKHGEQPSPDSRATFLTAVELGEE